MVDLIERARFIADVYEIDEAIETAAILRGLADEIERLRASLEAAERERDRLQDRMHLALKTLAREIDRREAAERERDETRAASPPAAPAAQPARPEESTCSHT